MAATEALAPRDRTRRTGRLIHLSAADAAWPLRAVSSVSGLHREAVPVEVGAGEEHSLLCSTSPSTGSTAPGGARRFLDELSSVADVRVIIVRLSSVRMPEDSSANALAEFIVDTQRQGITVLLKGIRPEHAKIMDSVGVRRVV